MDEHARAQGICGPDAALPGLPAGVGPTWAADALFHSLDPVAFMMRVGPGLNWSLRASQTMAYQAPSRDDCQRAHDDMVAALQREGHTPGPCIILPPFAWPTDQDEGASGQAAEGRQAPQ